MFILENLFMKFAQNNHPNCLSWTFLSNVVFLWPEDKKIFFQKGKFCFAIFNLHFRSTLNAKRQYSCFQICFCIFYRSSKYITNINLFNWYKIEKIDKKIKKKVNFKQSPFWCFTTKMLLL